MNGSEFGNTIRKFREEFGIGSRELSRMLGMTGSYISQLERGAIKKPNYYTAVKIFECLNIPKDIAATLLSSMGIRHPDPFEMTKGELFEQYCNDILPWLDEKTEKDKKTIQVITHSTNLLKKI